eukprot:2257588-Amphidinium_carterae.1
MLTVFIAVVIAILDCYLPRNPCSPYGQSHGCDVSLAASGATHPIWLVWLAHVVPSPDSRPKELEHWSMLFKAVKLSCVVRGIFFRFQDALGASAGLSRRNGEGALLACRL